MAEQYRSRYRTKSLRLQNWDYAWSAAYFITICTERMVFSFGDVRSRSMALSPIGVIADILWYEIKNHVVSVELHDFVVMPNHIHGIIVLNGNGNDISADNGISTGNDISAVETRHALSLQYGPYESDEQSQTIGQGRFQNQGKNTISSIVGSCKSAVSRHAHRLGYHFKWQSDYWEHIIRNRDDMHRISTYIRNNPASWNRDRFYAQK